MKARRNKIICFDSVGGASGDMILACLLDLGADLQAIRAGLKTMVKDRFDIKPRPVRQNGLRGTRVKVDIYRHGRHGHEHQHRNLNDIEKLIDKSRLSPRVKEQARGVFRRLARAEAKAHGARLSEIHFHEVGALDSIVDIVGSCIALEQLGADQVALGRLPLGCGTIKCAHGILPSPAPATVELLKGFAVEQTEEPFELVTPTGAALLTSWKNIDRAPAGATILRAGGGFGHFQLNNRPNLLRAVLLETGNLKEAGPHKLGGRNNAGKTAGEGRSALSTEAGHEKCLVLECNLDDMSPELTGHLFNRLLERGALDVFITPVQMKKNRPGAMLTVLCAGEQRNEMLDIIFRESTTFGVREYDVRRTVLPRCSETVKTPYGKVRVKIGSWRGRRITRAPEYDDCRKLAAKTGAPLRKIYEAAAGRFTLNSGARGMKFPHETQIPPAPKA
ncbi:MAG: nickel pincer cofactor biosynthesis protein LarC [Kiritimatiellae bacterium]|nr:nickel pincer cofactor biosynthesis protein LarC [Kiritimatiellia bacterium]